MYLCVSVCECVHVRAVAICAHTVAHLRNIPRQRILARDLNVQTKDVHICRDSSNAWAQRSLTLERCIFVLDRTCMELGNWFTRCFLVKPWPRRKQTSQTWGTHGTQARQDGLRASISLLTYAPLTHLVVAGLQPSGRPVHQEVIASGAANGDGGD